MGYFHTDAINIAKTTLWSKCNHDIIGAEQKHGTLDTDLSQWLRLNKIEKRMQKMCESLDGVIAENMALKDQINAVSVRTDPDPMSYAQITAHSSTRKPAESQRPVRPRTTSPGTRVSSHSVVRHQASRNKLIN